MMSRRFRSTRSPEGGFTMVELVISVAILGIMSIALGVVGTVMFRTLNQTQDRLTESRGPRFASVYWVPDVSSAEKINPATAGIPTVCGTGALVTLQWTDDRTAVTTVSYAIDTTGGTSKLVRRFCTNGTTVPVRTTTIAPNIATVGGATVTCASATTYTPCTTPDLDARSVLLTIKPKNGGTFSVDAIREVT
jgi:prepilin-type N-terminal cleavage/methylation domain-containing protein